MYSVTEGFDNVDKKLDDLVHDERHVEALLVSVLVMERTLRRILHFCAINRGFSPDHYELLLRKLKYDGIKKAWPKFDRVKRPLSKFVGEDNLQQMKKSFEMRTASHTVRGRQRARILRLHRQGANSDSGTA